MQVSAPVRVVALVGLLGALGMGAWTFAIDRNSADSTSSSGETSAVATNPVAAANAVAGKLNAHNKATAAGKPDVAPSRTATPTHKASTARSAHKATHHATAGASRPNTIAGLLHRHRVVVVLLYDPQSKVDAYSIGEAQLGAQNAKAGFLRVNVLNPRQSKSFATTYDELQTPTLLFFTRGGDAGGKLVQKLTGFADHESVAQAATNAAHGLVATAG